MYPFTSFFFKFEVQFTGNKIPFLVKCCHLYSNPGFNFTCISCITCSKAAKKVEIFYIIQLFLAIIICIGDRCLEILITLVFYPFLSIPQPLRTSINLSVMPYSLFLLQITAIIRNSYRHIN